MTDAFEEFPEQLAADDVASASSHSDISMAVAATTEAMQILAGIKDTPAWLQMQDAMKQEKKAFWQQVLAFHTSTCAQRGKAPGRVESLEEAGLREPLTDPGSG